MIGPDPVRAAGRRSDQPIRFGHLDGYQSSILMLMLEFLLLHAADGRCGDCDPDVPCPSLPWARRATLTLLRRAYRRRPIVSAAESPPPK
jgi:hypothetical protein